VQEQLAERDRLIAEQQRQIRDLQGQLDSLKEQILAGNRARFGQRSERGAYLQGSLFAGGQQVLTPTDEPTTAEEDETTQPPQRSGKRRESSRRWLHAFTRTLSIARSCTATTARWRSARRGGGRH